MSGRRRRTPLAVWVALVPAALGTAAAGVALWTLPSERHAYETAVALTDRGARAQAETVRVRASWTRYGCQDDAVEVTFDAPRARVSTRLVGTSVTEDACDQRGWYEPRDGRYALPLDVVYLPDDPEVAMATRDVDSYREDPTRELLVVAGVGAAVACIGWTGVVIGARRASRRRGAHRQPDALRRRRRDGVADGT